MLEINPAYGCEFRCAYCGIYALEKDYFGEVIVYDDYPAYLERWLDEHHTDAEDYYYYFSAKTDCFQPALLDSGITLECLKILKRHRASYFLVTKAGVPPEDIREALVEARDINQVIISATMPDESMREALEPGGGADQRATRPRGVLRRERDLRHGELLPRPAHQRSHLPQGHDHPPGRRRGDPFLL